LTLTGLLMEGLGLNQGVGMPPYSISLEVDAMRPQSNPPCFANGC
jgi:hypothetical protein